MKTSRIAKRRFAMLKKIPLETDNATMARGNGTVPVPRFLKYIITYSVYGLALTFIVVAVRLFYVHVYLPAINIEVVSVAEKINKQGLSKEVVGQMFIKYLQDIVSIQSKNNENFKMDTYIDEIKLPKSDIKMKSIVSMIKDIIGVRTTTIQIGIIDSPDTGIVVSVSRPDGGVSSQITYQGKSNFDNLVSKSAQYAMKVINPYICGIYLANKENELHKDTVRDYADSKSIFNELLKSKNALDHEKAYLGFGWIANLKKDTNEQIHNYQAAINVNVHQITALYNLGVVYSNKENFVVSHSYLERSIQSGNNSSDVYAEYGWALANLCHYNKARSRPSTWCKFRCA